MQDEYADYLEQVIKDHEQAKAESLTNANRCDAAILVTQALLAKYRETRIPPAIPNE